MGTSNSNQQRMQSFHTPKWYWREEVSPHPVVLVARAADAMTWGAIRTQRLRALKELLKEFHSAGQVDENRLAKAWFKVHDFARYHRTPAPYLVDALKAVYAATTHGHNLPNNNVVILSSLLQSGMPWDLMLSCISSRDEVTALLAAHISDAMLHEASESTKRRFMTIIRHYNEDSQMFNPKALLSPRSNTQTTNTICAFLSDYIYYGAREGMTPFPHLSILSHIEYTLIPPEPDTERPPITPYLLLLSILSSSNLPEVIDTLAVSPILLEVITWLNNLNGREWSGHVDYALRVLIALACTSISANRVITTKLASNRLSHLMVNYHEEGEVWLNATLLGWALSFTLDSLTDVISAIELAEQIQLGENKDHDLTTRAYLARFFGDINARVDFQAMQGLLHEWHEHESAKRGVREDIGSSIEAQLRTCLWLFNDIQPQITRIPITFALLGSSASIEG